MRPICIIRSLQKETESENTCREKVAFATCRGGVPRRRHIPRHVNIHVLITPPRLPPEAQLHFSYFCHKSPVCCRAIQRCNLFPAISRSGRPTFFTDFPPAFSGFSPFDFGNNNKLTLQTDQMAVTFCRVLHVVFFLFFFLPIDFSNQAARSSWKTHNQHFSKQKSEVVAVPLRTNANVSISRLETPYSSCLPTFTASSGHFPDNSSSSDSNSCVTSGWNCR